MTPACDVEQLLPGLFIWRAYDPAAKADLFSSALTTASGIYIVDPVPLEDSQLALLHAKKSVAGIIVTNANHQRAAADYSEKFSVPICARRETLPDQKPLRLIEFGRGAKIGDDLEAIGIEGAVAGEVALYHRANGGTLVVGDALINFEPYGFTFLPRKYCLNEKEMRWSLRKLLACEAERMLFAHGTPILSGASGRLQQLFGSLNRA